MTDSASPSSPGVPASSADSPSGAAPARPRNPIGLASFIVAVASEFIGLAFGLAVPALIAADDGFGMYQAGSFATSVLGFVLGLAAVVLGIVGLLRQGAPRGFAAAGTAIGAIAVVEIAVGFLQSALYSVF